MTNWRERFPDGRFIFYEGDGPDGFRKDIRNEFGFDPADRADWDDGTFSFHPAGRWGHNGYGFHCPAELLNAIYGGDRWHWS